MPAQGAGENGTALVNRAASGDGDSRFGPLTRLSCRRRRRVRSFS